MTIRDIQTLVTSLGWEVRQGAGSHTRVWRPGSDVKIDLSPKSGRYVKQYQLRLILKEIERGEGV